jgi:hypothetical protein
MLNRNVNLAVVCNSKFGAFLKLGGVEAWNDNITEDGIYVML